jgi:ketosteroid isomerase-like protein
MKTTTSGLTSLLLIFSYTATAGDIEDLSATLDEFLAHADQAPAHERFWAEDLVYTSSAGTRTNKAGILAGLAQADSAAQEEAGPAYHAEDVDIRVYGDVAVVAFRLVAASDDESSGPVEQHYLNTGTFRKVDGRWQSVAWQATKIP